MHLIEGQRALECSRAGHLTPSNPSQLSPSGPKGQFVMAVIPTTGSKLRTTTADSTPTVSSALPYTVRQGEGQLR